MNKYSLTKLGIMSLSVLLSAVSLSNINGYAMKTNASNLLNQTITKTYVIKDYQPDPYKDYPYPSHCSNEVHILESYSENDPIFKMTLNECHFSAYLKGTCALLFHGDAGYDDNAVIESSKNISGLTINWSSNDTLNVYTSKESGEALINPDYQFVDFDYSQTFKSESITFTNPTKYIKLKGNSYGDIYVSSISVDYVSTSASEFSTMFINETNNICNQDNIDASKFESAWTKLKKEYDEYVSSEDKEALKTLVDEGMNRYDIIVRKYNLEDFLGRNTNPASPNIDIPSMLNNNLTTIIVVATLGISAIAICLILNKKRKYN